MPTEKKRAFRNTWFLSMRPLRFSKLPIKQVHRAAGMGPGRGCPGEAAVSSHLQGDLLGGKAYEPEGTAGAAQEAAEVKCPSLPLLQVTRGRVPRRPLTAVHSGISKEVVQ